MTPRSGRSLDRERPSPEESRRITPDDIAAKLREVTGAAGSNIESARTGIAWAVVAGTVVLVGVAYLWGRRRGSRSRAFIEITRV